MMQRTLISGLFLLISCVVTAQDYRFSQYYNAPVLMNPAMSGSHRYDYRFNLIYRSQWSSISDTYRTFGGSFDMPMFGDVAGMSKLGLGLSFISDEAGSTNFGYNNVNLSLAYHFKTNRYTQLSAGILVGYGRHGADLSKVRWESQHNGSSHDPSLPSGEQAFVENINFFDAGVGGLWSSIDPYNDRSYEIGISAYHVNFPNHSFVAQYQDRLKPKIQVHAEADYGFDGYMLRPKLLIQNQGVAYSAVVGSMIRFRMGNEPDSRYTDVNISSALDFGVYYRYRESVTLTAQFDYHKNMLMALSYDILVGGLSRVSPAGGWEVSFRLQGMFKNNRLKIKKRLYKDEKDEPGKKKGKNVPNIRM